MSQRSRASTPSIRNPASTEMISESVELWDTDVCFLYIQLMGTNILLQKNTLDLAPPSPEVDFESSMSPAKSESWDKPQSTMLSRIAHMTILSEIFCVMNVWNQSCKPSVTCVSPFCDSSRKLVDRPQNARSSNSCEVQAFQDIWWANFWQFSNWFEFLLLELMIIQARTWTFVQLLHFLVCKLTVSFNAFFWACPSMS